MGDSGCCWEDEDGVRLANDGVRDVVLVLVVVVACGLFGMTTAADESVKEDEEDGDTSEDGRTALRAEDGVATEEGERSEEDKFNKGTAGEARLPNDRRPSGVV